jgi:ribosomal protein S18 acetylase RimI-like enzyme
MLVRSANSTEHAAVLSILDAAALQTDSDQIREAIERNDVFVAVATEQGTVLGALVLSGAEITAIAIRPGRRGQGLGRRLVAAAQRSRERLVAAFDPKVEPFWQAVGFERVGTAEDDRLRAVWEPE